MAKKYNVTVKHDVIGVIQSSSCSIVRSIDDIGDVVVGNDVTDGHVLAYDSIQMKWIAEPLTIIANGGTY